MYEVGDLFIRKNTKDIFIITNKLDDSYDIKSYRHKEHKAVMPILQHSLEKFYSKIDNKELAYLLYTGE